MTLKLCMCWYRQLSDLITCTVQPNVLLAEWEESLQRESAFWPRINHNSQLASLSFNTNTCTTLTTQVKIYLVLKLSDLTTCTVQIQSSQLACLLFLGYITGLKNLAGSCGIWANMLPVEKIYRRWVGIVSVLEHKSWGSGPLLWSSAFWKGVA